MIVTLIRSFITVFVCELGSASQFVIASTAHYSKQPLAVWIGGMLALGLSSFLAVKLGMFMNKAPIPPHLLSGAVMVIIGLIMIWKKD